MLSLYCSLAHWAIFFSSGYQEQQNKEELKAKIKEIIRGKSDAFNSENPEEDKVVLVFYY